jgi:hypothetical protein
MKVFENLQIKKVAKGTILLHKGEICRYAYKVITGCLKSYVIDKTGKEHILHFAAEDWLITDMDSFFNIKPANIFIDAIEASEVALLPIANNSDFEQLSQDDLLEINKTETSPINFVALKKGEQLIGVLQKSGFSAKLNICASNSATLQSPKPLCLQFH